MDMTTVSDPRTASFSRHIAHLDFKSRPNHNVEVELAKSNRKSVLNALNCFASVLSRHAEQLKNQLSCPVKDSNLNELGDVIATLHVVALRTLCETLMEKLPRELRETIYEFSFKDEQWYPSDKSLVTKEVLPSLTKRQWKSCFPGDDTETEVTDPIFMGRNVHHEFITYAYGNFRSWMWNSCGSLPSTDPWNYGIDPSKTINHLTIGRTLVNRDADRKSIGVRFDPEKLNLIGPALVNRPEDALWLLDLECAADSHTTCYALNEALCHVTRYLSQYNIPNSASVMMRLTNYRFLTYDIYLGYEGPLDSWLNFYDQGDNAKRVRGFLHFLRDWSPSAEDVESVRSRLGDGLSYFNTSGGCCDWYYHRRDNSYSFFSG